MFNFNLDPMEMANKMNDAINSGLLRTNHFVPESLQHKKIVIDLDEDDLPTENMKLFKVIYIYAK